MAEIRHLWRPRGGFVAITRGIAVATSGRVDWKHADASGVAFIETSRNAGRQDDPAFHGGNVLGIVAYPPIPTAAGPSSTDIPPETTPRAERSLLRLVRAAPRLPGRGGSMSAGGTLSLLIHASALTGLLLAGPLGRPAPQPARSTAAAPIADRQPLKMPRIVFLQIPGPGGGGGGGGNRQPTPPSRAQAIGRDRVTIPVAKRMTVTANPSDVTPPQQVVLDAKPLASGTTFVIGAPDGAWLPFSQGPGSGGGVGEGSGTGIGSGTGPGIGAGSGGGFGGGVYRPGGGVVPPVLVKEVKPVYTPEALRLRIQGSVLLEAIVGTDGIPVGIRVTRPLDRGLDEAAVAAAREWRFRPGRIGGTPVDVLVTIQMDFRVH